jgi:hypothetical protein
MLPAVKFNKAEAMHPSAKATSTPQNRFCEHNQVSTICPAQQQLASIISVRVIVLLRKLMILQQNPADDYRDS